VSDLQLAPGIKVVTQGKPNPVIVSTSVPVEEAEAPVVQAAPAAEKSKGKKSEKQNKK
jgi:large subunit ribosomal protein L25